MSINMQSTSKATNAITEHNCSRRHAHSIIIIVVIITVTTTTNPSGDLGSLLHSARHDLGYY